MKRYRIAINHSILMVRRNLKSYLLLSVTILLSFTFLLGYFVYSDSEIYNRYKELFSVPTTIGIVGHSLRTLEEVDTEAVIIEKHNYLISKLDKMKDTSYMRNFFYTDNIDYYGGDGFTVHATVHMVPKDFREFYIFRDNRIFTHVTPIIGDGIIENPNDIIIDQTFYDLLTGHEQKEVMTVMLPYISNAGERELKEYRVVGVVKSGDQTISSSEKGTNYQVDCYISQELIGDFDTSSLQKGILVISENIEQIGEMCKDLRIAFSSSYIFQQEAKKEIRNSIFIKGSIMIVLFVLLAINLYSSFSNALKDRRFEIGVKRALGAGKKDIILQFFLEGIVVMAVNIAMCIFLTIMLALIYKLVEKLLHNNTWTIYTSGYSMIMFMTSTVFLTVVFSFIFAYESTEVEIVKHLKAE